MENNKTEATALNMDMEIENTKEIDHSNEPTLSDAEYNKQCLTMLAKQTYESELDKARILERLNTAFDAMQLYSIMLDKHLHMIDEIQKSHPELKDELTQIYNKYIFISGNNNE